MDRYAAATYAPLIMYAWDMCDQSLHQIPPAVDPRITEKGWSIEGFLSAGDDIVKAGTTIRSTLMGAGDRVCYGYVATRQGEIVVVIRGTDGAEEWGDDLDFLMQRHPNPSIPGLVDQGFFGIYSTMLLHAGANPDAGQPAVQAIKEIFGACQVRVLGHSLGAAIATYLTLDLNLAGCPASACLFASPRTGNQAFIDHFETKVENYDLFNYERDLVPQVPVYDVLHLSAYQPLHQEKSIPVDGSAATISNDPKCNHHLICYTALLDPAAYRNEMATPNLPQDDLDCAKCVLSPKVG